MRKPSPKKIKAEPKAAPVTPHVKVRVHALCSLPRLSWTDHVGCVQKMLRGRGIELDWYTGAFWHKCMQGSIRDLCGSADWILTLDNDTLANGTQLDILLNTFANNPHFDALAAFQPRRGTGTPLLTAADEKGNKLTEVQAERPIKARTAHFGLTLIRTKSLLDLPKPWFAAVPNKDGEWDGPESIDPDIYFWKQWEKHGKTLYVDPNCRIGHIEMMCSIFDEFMVQRHITVTRWRELYDDSGNRCSLEKGDTKG